MCLHMFAGYCAIDLGERGGGGGTFPSPESGVVACVFASHTPAAGRGHNVARQGAAVDNGRPRRAHGAFSERCIPSSPAVASSWQKVFSGVWAVWVGNVCSLFWSSRPVPGNGRSFLPYFFRTTNRFVVYYFCFVCCISDKSFFFLHPLGLLCDLFF